MSPHHRSMSEEEISLLRDASSVVGGIDGNESLPLAARARAAAVVFLGNASEDARVPQHELAAVGVDLAATFPEIGYGVLRNCIVTMAMVIYTAHRIVCGAPECGASDPAEILRLIAEEIEEVGLVEEASREVENYARSIGLLRNVGASSIDNAVAEAVASMDAELQALLGDDFESGGSD